MQVDDDQYDFLYRRSTYPLWLKFRINKMEFRLLKQLNWYLKYKNTTVTSKQEFFDTITNNQHEKRLMEGYLKGLTEKKFIGAYEYIKTPGSLSIGLSDLGVNVLKSFKQHYDLLAEKYHISPFRLDQVNPSFTSKPRPYYKAKTA
jgi:hypothetical protein